MKDFEIGGVKFVMDIRPGKDRDVCRVPANSF